MDSASEKIFGLDGTLGFDVSDVNTSNLSIPSGSLDIASYALTVLVIGVLIGALGTLLLDTARNGPSTIANAIVRGVDVLRIDGMMNRISSAVENGINRIPIKRTGPIRAAPAGSRRR
ncbi:uncharacterized protein LOC122249116 [Penaeus japonicus]|uniref:uncharacterized protein LOC122249116 n=1 Tax=Penaeus japonicus TaxID=27405 RepID=UPI001C70F925|nr:uncharacterized protein LOC122249116 [Penaeus japonicus]